MKNYYAILGIKDFAEMPDIRRAYRRLALINHPDRGGDAERMKEINGAYEFLMKNKPVYDRQLNGYSPVGFTIIVGGPAFYETAGTTWTGTVHF